jgi:trimethylamine:corrinoid methyltransferase-like protein
MAQPEGMNERFREVLLAAELIQGTTKPMRSWVSTADTARFVLVLFRVVAGGEAALRAHPMTEGFLTEEHTVKHLRQELWLPSAPWTRQAFGAWESEGRLAMADRLQTEMQRLLKSHQPAPLAPDWSRALDEIVNHARESFVR